MIVNSARYSSGTYKLADRNRSLKFGRFLALMVYRNNAGRLGAGFLSVCLQTRWLGEKRGFYVLELHCSL